MLKLENLPEEFLKNQLLTEPLVKNSTECKEMIWNALLNPAKPKSDDRFDEKSACIIAHQPESRMLMQCELKTKTWSRFARIPADVYRNKLDIISVNGEVYLTSGDAISKFKNGNLVRLRDTGVKPFHPYHQCVLRDTVIYIIYFDQIYKYDTLNNMWNRLAAKLALGEGFFVASSDLFIYAMGGSGTGTFASEFDFRSEKWEPIAAMNNGRCYGAAIWSDERVYALGGSFYMDGWNETEFYIPKGNIWTLVFPVTRCLHCYCKAFYIGGKIYIVGGVNATKSTVSVNYTDRDGVSKTQTSPIMPNVAEIDLKKSTSTEIPSVKIYTGLACGVYTN